MFLELRGSKLKSGWKGKKNVAYLIGLLVMPIA